MATIKILFVARVVNCGLHEEKNMRRDVENQILDAKLPANAKLLMMLFARMCTPKNPLFSVNTAELAERMHLSRATIRKLVKQIEHAGLIKFELVFNKRERLYRFRHCEERSDVAIQKNVTQSTGSRVIARDDNMERLPRRSAPRNDAQVFTPPKAENFTLLKELPEEIQALVQVICSSSKSLPEFAHRMLPVIQPSGFTLDKQGEMVRLELRQV